MAGWTASSPRWRRRPAGWAPSFLVLTPRPNGRAGRSTSRPGATPRCCAGPATSEVVDYDADGACELLLESASQNVYLAPALGGAVVEWDVHGRNAADVIARRPEPYHDRLRLGGKGEPVSVLEEPLRVREPG